VETRFNTDAPVLSKALPDPSQLATVLRGTQVTEERVVDLGSIEELGTTAMGRDLAASGELPESLSGKPV